MQDIQKDKVILDGKKLLQVVLVLCLSLNFIIELRKIEINLLPFWVTVLLN